MPGTAMLAGSADTLFTATILAYSIAVIAFAADSAMARRIAPALVGPNGTEFPVAAR